MLFLISLITRFLLYLIGSTLRIRTVSPTPKEKVIYAFWHSDFFPLIYMNRFRDIAVLISTHRDGEYLSRVIKPLGYKIIRGGSDDGGAKGILQLLKLKTKGIAIAPDGPKGPVKQAKYGILKIAQLTGLPIVPVGVGMSNPVLLGSWDRFKIPLPFSKCTIYWGKPISVKKVSKEMKEELELALTKANRVAYKCLTSTTYNSSH